MRVFVALNLPYSVIQLCTLVQERIKKLCENEYCSSLRFIHEDQLHITLRPPLIVDQKGENDLIQQLITIKIVPFGICTTSVGFFEESSVIWLGIERSSALTNLVQAIENSINDTDSHKKKYKQFNGHITLARSFQAKNAHHLIDHLNVKLPAHCFLVCNFTLKETLFGSAGRVIAYKDKMRF